MPNALIAIIVVVLLLFFVTPMLWSASGESFSGHASSGLVQRGAPPTIRYF